MLTVNEHKCAGCGGCMPYCPEEAIWVWGVCEINADKCNECQQCIQWCPMDALEVRNER